MVMNVTDYLHRLGDSNFYTKLDYDPIPRIKESIDKTLHQIKSMGLINDNNLDYLSSDNYSEGRFYLLSEILKKVYQGYLYVALPNTLLAELVNNWLMNI